MIFCKHDWEVIKDEVHESPIEKLIKKGLMMEEGSGALLFGKHIIILQCKKCGKLDKTVERV